MIRDRTLKVKKFMLNGRIGWLYGEKSPANGIRKSHDIKVFRTISLDLCQILHIVERLNFTFGQMGRTDLWFAKNSRKK